MYSPKPSWIIKKLTTHFNQVIFARFGQKPDLMAVCASVAESSRSVKGCDPSAIKPPEVPHAFGIAGKVDMKMLVQPVASSPCKLGGAQRHSHRRSFVDSAPQLHPVHCSRPLPTTTPLLWLHPQHEPPRLLPRQRRHGKLLVHPQKRTGPQTQTLPQPHPRPTRSLRLHRNLLQPPTRPLLARLSQPSAYQQKHLSS